VVVAGADDLLEGVLEGGTANEEAINVGLGNQLIGILVSHRSTIKDSCLVSSFLGNVALNPATNEVVSLLSLFR
jgi:hypothetical protein